jgi:hypothetical protein
MLRIAGPTQKTLGRDPPLVSGHTTAAREATSWIDGRFADVQLAADLEQVVGAADSRYPVQVSLPPSFLRTQPPAVRIFTRRGW